MPGFVQTTANNLQPGQQFYVSGVFCWYRAMEVRYIDSQGRWNSVNLNTNVTVVPQERNCPILDNVTPNAKV
jgi:hypothetical protein